MSEMFDLDKKVKKFYRQSLIEGNVSINDLRDKFESGEFLSDNEKMAVANFEKYQLEVLSSELSDNEFHQKYQKLQVLANLSSYTEFLDEKYA